jgi:hypothetical protein
VSQCSEGKHDSLDGVGEIVDLAGENSTGYQAKSDRNMCERSVSERNMPRDEWISYEDLLELLLAGIWPGDGEAQRKR